VRICCLFMDGVDRVLFCICFLFGVFLLLAPVFFYCRFVGLDLVCAGGVVMSLICGFCLSFLGVSFVMWLAGLLEGAGCRVFSGFWDWIG